MTEILYHDTENEVPETNIFALGHERLKGQDIFNKDENNIILRKAQ